MHGVDFSSPKKHSVNHGISTDMCSLSYVSVDDAAKLIMARGPGACLFKIDIKNAYRIIRIHPDDQHLLGMKWGAPYMCTCLATLRPPFSPKIFTAVADAVQWIVEQGGM